MATVAGFGGVNALPLGAGPAPAGAAERPRALEGGAGRLATPWSFKLLLAFLFLLFANLPLLVPRLEVVAPAQTAALAAFGLLFAECTIARRPLRMAWPESYLLLVFVAVSALSTFTALWPKHALDSTVILLKFAVIYLLILNTVESWQRLRAAFAVIAVGTLFPALGALRKLQAGDFVEGNRVGWIGIFEGPNDLAYALTVLFPLVLALALGEWRWSRGRGLLSLRGLWRLGLWGILALLAVATFSTYSRSGLLGFAVVLSLCLLRWSPPAARLPLLALAAVAAALVLSTYWGRDEGFGDLLADATLNERLATIEVGLAMFADRPLLGVGLGCSVLGWPIYAEPGTSMDGWLHSHNSFIEVLSETGLLGTVPFLLLVGLGLRRANRISRRLAAAGRTDLARLVSALEISLWGFLACGLAGGWILTWFPYLVLGLAGAARFLPEPAAEGPSEHGFASREAAR